MEEKRKYQIAESEQLTKDIEYNHKRFRQIAEPSIRSIHETRNTIHPKKVGGLEGLDGMKRVSRLIS